MPSPDELSGQLRPKDGPQLAALGQVTPPILVFYNSRPVPGKSWQVLLGVTWSLKIELQVTQRASSLAFWVWMGKLMQKIIAVIQ